MITRLTLQIQKSLTYTENRTVGGACSSVPPIKPWRSFWNFLVSFERKYKFYKINVTNTKSLTYTKNSTVGVAEILA